MSIKQSKMQLRKSTKALLAAIPMDEIQLQSKQVLLQLLKLEQFNKAKSVAVFMNMPNLEVQTMNIIKSCFDANKRVYLPRCQLEAANNRKKNHLHMVRMATFDDVISLTPQGKYNLLEPTTGPDILEEGNELDIILVPGVAFTRLKQRLGHGAGFYDEFLLFYKSTYNKSPYLIGIGLKQQLVSQIPTEPHDWSLDSLVIGDEVI